MKLLDSTLDQFTSFYVVAKGRQTGVFNEWDIAERQVKGFAGAVYQCFPAKQKAIRFLADQLEKHAENGPLNADELETLESCKQLLADWPQDIVFPSLI